LEHSLHRFLTRFDCAGGSTEEKLQDLQSRQREYLSLKKVADSFSAKQSGAQESLEQASRWLEENLAPYFGPDLPLDPFATLHWKCSEYQTLASRRAESTERAATLLEELRTLEQELRRFLEPYVGTVEPDGFQSSLTALQRDCDTYGHNQTFVLNYERESIENRENLQIYTRQILDFAGKYKLSLDAGSRQAAFSIRDDVRKYAQLSASNGSLREEIDTFSEKNRGIIESPNVLDEYDLEELKTAKEQAEQDIADTASQILSLQQQIKQLQIDLDQIPQKEDELAGLRELCGESQRKAALLDDTIAMLKTAKDNMSANYLSIIRSSFSEYLHRVTGEASENIYINPQLDVRLERQGETRDIGYFSAGQADIILLCMRMALVRALFRGEKPFIVLDDPFVNLDDEKTTEALALLTDLSKEYQIIYLICHSSRTEEE
ncbi:MAG: hypothetical protein K2O18_19745, partial [Oscillospiraceae bacterium]|nr:hypothetical protein [Oscillospiraceae bacterium]